MSSLLLNNKPIWQHSMPICRHYLALHGACSEEEIWVLVNPDTIGCVWTGKFDLNMLCVDGEIFEFGKKKLWIQKYPDSCRRGLSFPTGHLHVKFLYDTYVIVFVSFNYLNSLACKEHWYSQTSIIHTSIIRTFSLIPVLL